MDDFFKKCLVVNLLPIEQQPTIIFLGRYFLNIVYAHPENENYYLTQQEVSYLKQLLIGRSSKEAAKHIHLSHRIVEYYLVRIKNRFNAQQSLNYLKFSINTVFCT